MPTGLSAASAAHKPAVRGRSGLPSVDPVALVPTARIAALEAQTQQRKEQLPDISHLGGDFGTAISARLMQMFLKEFMYLPAAVSEWRGLREMSQWLKELEGSKWLFPD